MVKVPHSVFDSSVKIHRLADLRLIELQSCLGGGLRSPSASILAVIVFDNLDCLANCKTRFVRTLFREFRDLGVFFSRK